MPLLRRSMLRQFDHVRLRVKGTGFSAATGKPAMADKDIIVGRVINFTGAIGVLSGIILFLFGIVLLVFRRGFGFELSNPFHWFW